MVIGGACQLKEVSIIMIQKEYKHECKKRSYTFILVYILLIGGDRPTRGDTTEGGVTILEPEKTQGRVEAR